METKTDKILRVLSYLDQSPLVWGGLFVSLIVISFWIDDKNKLASDLCLILAGAVSPRIRSPHKVVAEPKPDHTG
jgi:hypothetical protein